MGQQQLLLVILVTIIVGIATVVAINTFSSAADSANVDAVRQDLLSMASTAQGWVMKPDMMGGGANAFDGTNGDAIELEDLNCTGDISGSECTNENGTYAISGQAEDEFIIEGTPSSAGGGIQIRVCKDEAMMGDYDAAASDGASVSSTPDACPTS